MITWLKEFLYDESVFERTIRATMFFIGSALQQGIIPAGKYGWWGSFILQASALLVPAGQKNKEP